MIALFAAALLGCAERPIVDPVVNDANTPTENASPPTQRIAPSADRFLRAQRPAVDSILRLLEANDRTRDLAKRQRQVLQLLQAGNLKAVTAYLRSTPRPDPRGSTTTSSESLIAASVAATAAMSNWEDELEPCVLNYDWTVCEDPEFCSAPGNDCGDESIDEQAIADEIDWMTEALMALLEDGEYHPENRVTGLDHAGAALVEALIQSGFGMLFADDADPCRTARYARNMGAAIFVYYGAKTVVMAAVFKSVSGTIAAFEGAVVSLAAASAAAMYYQDCRREYEV